MNELGVIGLGTMGANLARNAARCGHRVVVFNRTIAKTDEFFKAHHSEGRIETAESLKELVGELSSPRVILLMVNAGAPVDSVLSELVPLLSYGDIVVDGGNSEYRDTAERTHYLANHSMSFVGMGVSGGEEGALKGPSMMLGCTEKAYAQVKPLLEPMAAVIPGGARAFGWFGLEGAGHFVKTVHNGVEYAIMQLLAEAVHVLHVPLALSFDRIADLFEQWKAHPAFDAFLVEATIAGLRAKGESGEPLLDAIKDSAAQKGTGRWTVEAGYRYGVSIPTITAAVDARIVSSAWDFRQQQAKRDQLETVFGIAPVTPDDVRDALAASIANAYAQGFQLLGAASAAEHWNINISEVCRVWSAGCIVRSGILPLYRAIFSGNAEASATLLSWCSGQHQQAWRRTVAYAVAQCVPVPANSSALTYFDAYRTARLPQYVVQAQRDYFGSHGFERLDKDGTFHGPWQRG